MSHEKPHTDEARKSVHRNCVSADASAFDLFSIVAPNGPPDTPAAHFHLAYRHVTSFRT